MAKKVIQYVAILLMMGIVLLSDSIVSHAVEREDLFISYGSLWQSDGVSVISKQEDKIKCFGEESVTDAENTLPDTGENEHVNENKYAHQWCRVKVGKKYWICDAYGLYCGSEPGKRKHPYF